jgi:DNA-binding response OmpR family regulator
MKSRLLIVEDDVELAGLLADNFSFIGWEVECVCDGEGAVRRASEFRPDLVLLDIMLPDKSGFEVCRALQQGGRTAVIFVTARGQKADKIRGLQLGADDYIAKPFELEELLARAQAVMRRSRPPRNVLVLGKVAVDFHQRCAVRDRRRIHFTHKEFEVLRYLAEHANQIVYRGELLRDIWGYSGNSVTRCVDQTVARLRKKIEVDAHRPRFIHTVSGDGYWLTPTE